LMSLTGGTKKYTSIPAPALVIFANPHSLGAWVDNNTDPAVQEAAKAYSTALAAFTQRQEKAVEHGVPTTRVTTVTRANHYIFLSNEAYVLREVRAFITGLE
jgi:non-heme chloroperoxidase